MRGLLSAGSLSGTTTYRDLGYNWRQEQKDTAELIEGCRKMASEAHVRTVRYGGTAGDRNVHEMSGRTQ